MTTKIPYEIYHQSETRLDLCKRLSPTSSFRVDVKLSEDSKLIVTLNDVGLSHARKHEYHFDKGGVLIYGAHGVNDPVYHPKNDFHSIETVDVTVLLRFGRRIKEIFDLYQKENKIPEMLSSHPIVNVMANQTLESYLNNTNFQS